jgi:hypothetical protein
MEGTMLTAFIFFPVFALIGLAFYFLPTILASQRGHHNVLGVFLLNFFLGWSVIAWIIALVWALSRPPVVVVQGYPPAYAPPAAAATLCSRCGVPLAPGTSFCGNCGTHV